jgi:hypothetical protein
VRLPFAQTADSLGAAIGAVRDTLTEAPLPGGAATFFRFLFQVPQWIQIGGAIAGAVVALLLLRAGWKRRRPMLAWLESRSRQVQAGLGVLVLLLVGAGALMGMKTWDYMQHDNGFCTGCHIMERPFKRFAAGAGKHEELKCHDCHQQSMYASARQMYLWVAERPEKIGVHAPVPNQRCRSCHEQGGTERWQQVMRLAGHKVHFDSDSSALAGLACVQCHGQEVHKFVPSAQTCAQSGCHEKQVVQLAGMASLPEINCVTCHAFTQPLPGLASRDSAVSALVPNQEQCFSCHQMRQKPKGFDPDRDPHQGRCGACHDVHAHRTPGEARERCATCHADLSRSAFHQGAAHRRVIESCLTCHQPHAASVDASNCVGCHNEVRKRGVSRPPVPFDTSAVLRQRVTPPPAPAAPEPIEHRGKGDALPEEPPPRVDPPRPVAPAADSFPHPRHTSLACLTCHVPNSSRSALTFEAPRGCDLCHHQRVLRGAVEARDCARCHRQERIAAPHPSILQIRTGARAPVPRTVGFQHQAHQRVACADCHRPPGVSPPDSVRTCVACHDQHHLARRDCAQCHTRQEARAAHPRAAHTGCDACHTPARIAALTPDRALCLTCHVPQRTHYPLGECTVCHFLETPAEFRRRLLTRGP